jgi:hypothetical protein
MTPWELQIPHYGRSGPITDVGEAAQKHLTGDDRAVAWQIAKVAMLSRFTNVGEFLDRIDELSQSERRRVLDCARKCAGLETTGAIDARDEMECNSQNLRIELGRGNLPTELVFGSNGVIRELPAPRSEARDAAREQSRQAQREARHLEQAEERKEARALREAHEARWRREAPPGFA